MSGIFSVVVEEARGFVAVPADLDRLAVVLGCSSAGSGFSPFYLSGSAAVTGVGYGDAPDALCQIIEQRQSSGSGRKFPAAMYTTPAGTVGSYGTIDITGVTGTCDPAARAASVPRSTCEAKVLVVTGGNVGTAGITYKLSLDNGRTYSNTTALGTASTIIDANQTIGFTLDPAAASLVALANDIRSKALLHFPKTASSVHGSADSTSDDGIGAACADNAGALVLAGTLRAGIILHFARGSTVHLTADIVNGAAIPAAPVTQEDARVVLIALKAALNAHEVDNTYHTGDDNNIVAVADVAASTLVEGDMWFVRTLAPKPGTSDVDAAFTALAAAPGDFALVVCEFPCDAAMLAHITTGLDALLAVGKRCSAIARARLPNWETSESEATWATLIEADQLSFSDSRIHVRGEYGLLTDSMTTRQYLRSDLAEFAADVVRVKRFEWPCAPADRPVPNFTLVNAAGNTVGHDEGGRGAVTGLSNDTLGNRFGSAMRLPDPARREAVYNTVPWVLYAADERIRNLMTRRVVNALERVAVSAAIAGLGGVLFYVPADPDVPGSLPTLTEASRNAAHGIIFQAISQNFQDDIQNADDADGDAGLVQVSPIVVVSGGNLLTISVTLAPVVLGYLLSLDPLTIAVKE